VLSLKNSGLAPPKHLSREARGYWGKLAQEYGIDDDAGMLVLTTAFEAHDRMREAQARIAKDGTTVVDRFGQIKGHPLLPTERDARAQFLAALRQLNLDVEPVRDGVGRSSGG
jgi:P27 family predicted phage terminase small subunit